MIKNPVATPLNTSIEFTVFPANGIDTNIKGIYNIGIYTLPKITFNPLSYTWKNINGNEAKISAPGLNHPGMILKSSIIPIMKAILVVSNIPIISIFSVMKNNINSPIRILNNNIGPPGLGTLGLFGLWLSFTTLPLSFRKIMNLGIMVKLIRNAMMDAITVPNTNPSRWGKNNYSTVGYLYIYMILV